MQENRSCKGLMWQKRRWRQLTSSGNNKHSYVTVTPKGTSQRKRRNVLLAATCQTYFLRLTLLLKSKNLFFVHLKLKVEHTYICYKSYILFLSDCFSLFWGDSLECVSGTPVTSLHLWTSKTHKSLTLHQTRASVEPH